MQRTATPRTPVRFRLQPPLFDSEVDTDPTQGPAVKRPSRPLASSPRLARMVKLVDTRDLKYLDHFDRAGSSPAPGTMNCYKTVTCDSFLDIPNIMPIFNRSLILDVLHGI